MNQTHLHLLINHLPILGSLLGGLVLAYGVWAKSDQTKTAAYGVLVISSVGALIAYLTGEGAEEAVENITGVSESVMERHSDSALVTLICLLLLGVSSLIGMWLIWRQSRLSDRFAVATLFIALLGFGLASRTGYFGGQIRHTEITTSTENR